MDQQDARWEISKTLEGRGFRHTGPHPDKYRGRIVVGHERAEIEIEIPDLEFVRLPRIKFVDPSTLSPRTIAHLELGTGLCYADGTLLRLDKYRPGASILRVLEEAEKTIAKSLAGQAAVEMALEYPRYWGGRNIQVLVEKSDLHIEARVATSTDLQANQVFVLIGKDQPVPFGFGAIQDALIVSIQEDLGPTDDCVAPKTLSQLERWFKSYRPSGIEFPQILEALSMQQAVFFSGKNAWVGCEIKLPVDLRQLARKQNIQPGFLKNQLAKRKDAVDLIHHYGSAANLDHVTSRNLPAKVRSLKNQKIALLGCGTIGSHLARFLIQSGAGNGEPLWVFDHQQLTAGNIGRHLLNFRDIGRSKSDAIADALRCFHPQTKINPVNADVRDVWHRFSDFDLIIDGSLCSPFRFNFFRPRNLSPLSNGSKSILSDFFHAFRDVFPRKRNPISSIVVSIVDDV